MKDLWLPLKKINVFCPHPHTFHFHVNVNTFTIFTKSQKPNGIFFSLVFRILAHFNGYRSWSGCHSALPSQILCALPDIVSSLRFSCIYWSVDAMLCIGFAGRTIIICACVSSSGALCHFGKLQHTNLLLPIFNEYMHYRNHRNKLNMESLIFNYEYHGWWRFGDADAAYISIYWLALEVWYRRSGLRIAPLNLHI